MTRRSVVYCLAGVLGLCSIALARQTILQDSFANVQQWASTDGPAPQAAKITLGTHAMQCMMLGNGVAKAELPDVIHQSWVLAFDALNCDWQRALWVGLFNAEGTQGYAATWDSSKQAFGSGQGFVSIARFSLRKPVTWADQLGKLLTAPVPSGAPAVGGQPAHIVLAWDQPSGTLTLKVNNVIKARCVDKTFASFARVYVRGNERSLFANLRVTLRSATTQPARAR